MSDFDPFERIIPEKPVPLAFEGEPHAKLKRNLDLALDVHRELMEERTEPSQKYLALQAANTTVKAALTTDRTALKARSERTIERVFLRMLFVKLQHGLSISEGEMRRLRGAPRAELEAALGPRIADYDRWEKQSAGL